LRFFWLGGQELPQKKYKEENNKESNFPYAYVKVPKFSSTVRYVLKNGKLNNPWLQK